MKTIRATINREWLIKIEDDEEPEEVVPQIIEQDIADNNNTFEREMWEAMDFEELTGEEDEEEFE